MDFCEQSTRFKLFAGWDVLRLAHTCRLASRSHSGLGTEGRGVTSVQRCSHVSRGVVGWQGAPGAGGPGQAAGAAWCFPPFLYLLLALPSLLERSLKGNKHI